jgi:hypothetical protein
MEIGDPSRTYTIDPIEDPVPREEPIPAEVPVEGPAEPEPALLP